MQRRKGNISFQPRHHAVVDQYRPGIIRPTMDDPMTDGDGIYVALVAQPGTCDRHGGWHICHAFDRIGAVGQRIAFRPAGPQAGPAADPIHLALDLPPQPTLAIHREDLEFDAGGTSIDDQDRVHGDHAAAMGVLRRRASA